MTDLGLMSNSGLFQMDHPNNCSDKNICLEFPPRRGEQNPPMWGFIPHAVGEILGMFLCEIVRKMYELFLFLMPDTGYPNRSLDRFVLYLITACRFV